jgi:hypothetical protein
MAVTIEEAKAFIKDAIKSKEHWQVMADRSWNEIKKRQKNHRLWSVTPNSLRRRARYPVWYSIFRIRQPLLLSRVGIPIGKDTTQDGNDNVGATAALCLERLAINLAKSFDFFDVMSACRDDFLITNFALCRAYYERDEVTQNVKEYITPQQDPDTGEAFFSDEDGNRVESDEIGQDDEGFFIEHESTVDVENERVCLEPVLYREVYVDPDIRRWNRCKRIAFAEHYSQQEFKEIFGAKALANLPSQGEQKAPYDEAYHKRQLIKVFEYWDEYEKEVYWFSDLGNEFLTPVDYYVPDDEEAQEADVRNGLYDLQRFFPVPDPLLLNQPTDEFWPVPEYYQLVEVLEDIHTIFSRMVALTKAIRARLLFDNNIEGLQAALNEATEGDAFGVPNLAQALASAGGSLENVVQYIPVEQLINGLAQIYQALEQRLNTLYKLTGTSDLLQGFVTDQTERTFGERQLQEKYALNQSAEPQRKMQEFVRGSYQLLCEMALKNFKDASLDMYIMPATLPQEHQQRYSAAIGMLKENQKRFRIELETDSTIALNEDYDKKMRLELVNTLTSALEKTASVAQQNPALIVPELHCLKYLVQGFRHGKMFQNEITEAIDAVIQQTQQPQEPAFNKDEADNKLEQLKLQIDTEMRGQEIQSKERIEMTKLSQEKMIADLESQVEQFKIQSDNFNAQAEQQQSLAKLQTDIQLAQEKLALDRDALMVELRKITGNQEVMQFSEQTKAQLAQFEMALAQSTQQLEQYKVALDEKEKYATEARLQAEHQLELFRTHIEMLSQQQQQQPQAVGPTINLPNAPTPPPPPMKKKIKVTRDDLGNVKSYEIEGQQGYQVIRDANGNIIGYEPIGGA